MQTEMTKGAKKRALSFLGFPTGTYHPFMRNLIEYNMGFQVSFVRPRTFDTMSDDLYDETVFELMLETKSNEHVGVYKGNPETSFYLTSFSKAMKIAKNYNQDGIWDWENEVCVENPFQDLSIVD